MPAVSYPEFTSPSPTACSLWFKSDVDSCCCLSTQCGAALKEYSIQGPPRWPATGWKGRKGLSREVMELLSLEMFKERLEMALSDKVVSSHRLDLMTWELISSLTDCVILWVCSFQDSECNSSGGVSPTLKFAFYIPWLMPMWLLSFAASVRHSLSGWTLILQEKQETFCKFLLLGDSPSKWKKNIFQSQGFI